MKGCIIIGYPGVGKSSVSGWENCIDLQSEVIRSKFTDVAWETIYVSMANTLAMTGYTVFVSSHPIVIEKLRDSHRKLEYPIVIFCPARLMREKWIERLKERYEKTKLPKDERAFRRARDHYDEDIYALVNYSGLPVYQPEHIDYDLKNYVEKIWHDWCMEDNKQ